MATAADYAASIEQFKGTLKGGGVRPTMFQVKLNFPSGVSSPGNDADADYKVSFLIKAAQLPVSEVGMIEVPFRGRKMKVSGDRVFQNWSVTIINDDSFKIRKSLEKWSELIQNHNFALGTTLLDDYFCDATVTQLDRDASPLRIYEFRGIWPMNIGQIDLDYDNTGDIETYECEFAVQYWGAASGGDDVPQPSDGIPNLSNYDVVSS
jgi:hypothetical protein